MSPPTLQRLVRLSLIPGICIALALVAGADANKDKAANNATIAPQAADTANQLSRAKPSLTRVISTLQAADTANQLSGANPSPGKVIDRALGSRLPSPRTDGNRSWIPTAGGECSNACGEGDIDEGEPCLVDLDVDTTNGGCNSDPIVFGPGACSVTICGTASTYLFVGACDDDADCADGETCVDGMCLQNRRDTDWYLISPETLAAADNDRNGVVQIRSTVTSEFPAVTFIVAIGTGCDVVAVVGDTGWSDPDCAGGDSAEYTVVLADHPEGIVAFVAPGNQNGSPIVEGVECDLGANGYILLIECIELPTACAEGSGCCSEANGTPGCDNPDCCALVCEISEDCCLVEWDQFCADFAIDLGCAPPGCDFIIDQPWDGVTAGRVAQIFPDFPDFDTFEFDDIHTVQDFVITTMFVPGAESAAGDPKANTAVIGEIWDGLPGVFGGSLVMSSVGGVENPDESLTIDFGDQVLPAGDYWVTAYVVREFGVGEQWFWFGTNANDPNGSEEFFYNPGGGFGFGGDPIPGSVVFGITADQAFSFTGKPVGGKPCPWDLDDNGVVGGTDLLSLLVNWGPCEDCDDCPADFDGNCSVGGTDLLALLVNWGPCP